MKTLAQTKFKRGVCFQVNGVHRVAGFLSEMCHPAAVCSRLIATLMVNTFLFLVIPDVCHARNTAATPGPLPDKAYLTELEKSLPDLTYAEVMSGYDRHLRRYGPALSFNRNIVMERKKKSVLLTSTGIGTIVLGGTLMGLSSVFGFHGRNGPAAISLIVAGSACLTAGFIIVPTGAIRWRRNQRYLEQFQGPTSSFDGYIDEQLRREWRKGLGLVVGGISMLVVGVSVVFAGTWSSVIGYGSAATYVPMGIASLMVIGSGFMISHGNKRKHRAAGRIKRFNKFRSRQRIKQEDIILRGVGPIVSGKGVGGLGALFSF